MGRQLLQRNQWMTQITGWITVTPDNCRGWKLSTCRLGIKHCSRLGIHTLAGNIAGIAGLQFNPLQGGNPRGLQARSGCIQVALHRNFTEAALISGPCGLGLHTQARGCREHQRAMRVHWEKPGRALSERQRARRSPTCGWMPETPAMEITLICGLHPCRAAIEPSKSVLCRPTPRTHFAEWHPYLS